MDLSQGHPSRTHPHRASAQAPPAQDPQRPLPARSLLSTDCLIHCRRRASSLKPPRLGRSRGQPASLAHGCRHPRPTTQCALQQRRKAEICIELRLASLLHQKSLRIVLQGRRCSVQVCLELCRDAVEFLRCQSQGRARFRWLIRAMQVEDCFTAGAHQMHMCWAVIVGMDGHPPRHPTSCRAVIKFALGAVKRIGWTPKTKQTLRTPRFEHRPRIGPAFFPAAFLLTHDALAAGPPHATTPHHARSERSPASLFAASPWRTPALRHVARPAWMRRRPPVGCDGHGRRRDAGPDPTRPRSRRLFGSKRTRLGHLSCSESPRQPAYSPNALQPTARRREC